MVCYSSFTKNIFSENYDCNVIERQKDANKKMLNNFKGIFGNETDVILCFGDFEKKQQMKYKEAIKGKGMRTLFRKKQAFKLISLMNLEPVVDVPNVK